MPYIPKSQYDVKYTNGQELYNSRTGEEYKGDYIQYGQKYFAGNTITNLKVKLEKIDTEENLVLKNTRNFLYNQLNPGHYKKVKKRFRPVASKARPTEKDYEKGIWTRYFCQQVNRHENIFELNTEGYKKFKQGEYDDVLYRSGEIKWSLRESQINNDNVLKMIRQYPNIQFLFSNPREFVSNSNENLTAGLNELFYPDGSPYPEGAMYHIHPDKGPMEGVFHISGPHSLLTFDRPQVQIQNNKPTQYTPSFTTPPPSSYSGGSGGY